MLMPVTMVYGLIFVVLMPMALSPAWMLKVMMTSTTA
jgi:hypothetical protein